MKLNSNLTARQVLWIEIAVIMIFSFLPLLLELPYRVNIFVSWEGAYRMYLGQMPFRDFGLPLGYGYWIVPFIFFKIFGPKVFTLIIAQCFINLIALITFRNILKLFGLSPVQILISVTVFCLTYVMVHFWPWYNHTVFIYELVGLYFLLRYILRLEKLIFLILSSFFMALCFFTKQDAGGLGLMLSVALLLVSSIVDKKIKPLLLFLVFYGIALAILILPLLRFDFSYWFNYGQAPHFSRINLYDFLTAFFEESLWLKFYIVCAVIISIWRFKNLPAVTEDKRFLMFTLFTIGILIQAMIVQVTSFSPPTTNFYFHSFAIAFLVYNLSPVIHFEKVWIAVAMLLMIFFWRSENYWKYSMRLFGKFLPPPPPATVVSKNTWSSKSDSTQAKPVLWSLSPYKTFEHIKLPVETIKGMERVQALKIVKGNNNLSCLNMSNLSPLAYELNYVPPKGEHFPLWYHKGVAFFDRETKMICEQIEKSQFDLVLFEVMPDVDGFFPLEVRECLVKHYKLADTFISPTGYQTDFIEVYIRGEAIP